MMSVNKVILIGNVGRDPEMVEGKAGRIAKIALATSERWNDKTTGEKKEKAEWHNVVIFGKLVDIVEQYVKKGSKLYIEGKLTTNKYTDKAGVVKYSTSVVIQGFGGVLQMLNKVDAPAAPAPAPAPAAAPAPAVADEFSDDIPF